ncbi:MAG TPA: glpG protein [Treponema sp.]|nr:glpG protein [Treponema sp.]
MKAGTIIRRPFKYTDIHVTLYLAAINILVYVGTLLFPGLRIQLSLYPPAFIYGKMYWQLFTYMFVHGSFEHIFFNMFGLIMFGLAVERALGSKEFLLYYLVCGTASGALSLAAFVLTGHYNIALIGASGAVYAVLFAFAVVYPRSKVYFWGVLPIPSPVLVVIYAVIELVSQAVGFNGGVAHMTHLFGLAAAWLYFIIRTGINPVRVWKDAFKS